MLANSDELRNDNNNNNFPAFSKEADDRCETDDENIDVEIDSDMGECNSDHRHGGDSEDPDAHDNRLCEVRSEQSSNNDSQSDASQSSSPRRTSTTSPHLSEPEDNDGVHGKRKISRLSFGIDRILNGENDKTSSLSARPAPGSGDHRNDVIPASTTPAALLSPVSPKHLSPLAAQHQRTLPLDLVSSLNPFHGAFMTPDVCRMEPSSLDILPVRPAWPDVYVCPWTGVQRDRFGLVRRVGHPYQNRTPPKRKKPRTAFTRQQVLELEKRFTRQKYLASAERSALAKTLNMTDAQVKTWFQNRRTKWRRQTAEEREIERQAAHKFLMSLRQDDSARPMPYSSLCGVGQNASHPGSDNTAPPSGVN